MATRHPPPPARRLPNSAAWAGSVTAGLVFGTMGGPFAVITELTVLILIAVGVWRAVGALVDIYERLDHTPHPTDSPDSTETVRLP